MDDTRIKFSRILLIIRSFLTTVTAMLFVLGCGMALTGLAVTICGDWLGSFVLLGCACVSMSGYGLLRRERGHKPSRNLGINSAAVAIGWFISSLYAALPIWIIAVLSSNSDTQVNDTLVAHCSFLNAWYDGTSSITSAGLTATLTSSELTPAIQLWRSVGQWIGGVGMAVLAVKFVADDRQSWMLYQGETRQWSSENLNAILRHIGSCYIGLTVACGILFWLAGMPAWQTVNHCLIIVSTGGLTVVDDSFTGYSVTIQGIACVFMLLGAISFSAVHLALSGRWRRLVVRSDLRGFFALAVAAIGILAGLNRFSGDPTTWDQIFNLISAITTCGVSSGSVSSMMEPVLLLLVALMLIGGCSDSTAGGSKTNRFLWLLKVVRTEVRRVVRRNQDVIPPRWSQQPVEEALFHSSTHHCIVIVTLFAMTYAIAIMALRVSYGDDIGLLGILFQSASAISTVGLSMDLTGPDRPVVAKLVEIGLMIAGRLEIMAIVLIPFVVSGRADAEATSPRASGEVV